jgi:UDP-N-acetylmuramyl pentapeptide phosphotransferase/UDP-N-acetylglucosamine-1-phosphate transferase
MLYLIISLVLFISILVYFKIADHFNIIDKPNGRSSHTEITIRGGGIIYLIAALIAVIIHPEYWMPVLAMFIIGTISFIDDRVTLSRKIRMTFQLTAVTILFYYLGLFTGYPLWLIPLLYIFVIGIINAYNFMDGINGITGVYSLVILAGLQYVNYFQVKFIHPDFIWLPIIASLVFLFFNFRNKARCFAGDVGSVTVAFWIIMLLMQLMINTGHLAYILFLAVYGVDAILTIIHRLFLRQNIFDAHRLHFYQILANDQNWSHLVVSTLYCVVQLLIIILVIFFPAYLIQLFLVSTLPLMLIYVLVKPRIMIGEKS